MVNRREQDSGSRVLVIDPDPEERWRLVYLLKRRNIRVVATSSGRTGLDYLSRHAVGLVISAVVLSDFPGLGIIRGL